MQVTYFISESNELVCMILECFFSYFVNLQGIKTQKNSFINSPDINFNDSGI